MSLSIFKKACLVFMMMHCLIGKAQIDIEPIYISELRDEYPLIENIIILEDKNGDLQFRKVLESLKSGDFVSFDESYELKTESSYWTYFKLSGQDGFNHQYNDWKLFIGKPDYATVYICDDTLNVIQELTCGSLLPSDDNSLPVADKFQRVNLKFKISDNLGFLVHHIKKDRHPHFIEFKLSKFDFYQSFGYVLTVRRDWLFLGFLLTMILFNLILFARTKDMSYLWHGIFIVGAFGLTLDYFDALDSLGFIQKSPQLTQLVNIFFVALVDISYLLFIRYFLDLKSIMPFWDKLFRRIILLKLIFYPVVIIYYYLSFNEPLCDKIISYAIVAEFMLAAVFLIPLYKTKEPKGYFLIVGSLFLFAAIFLNGISLILGNSIWTAATQIGVTGEIICFSFGLAFRFKELKDEEQVAINLKELNAFKAKLFANITHEFRTPLTVIKGVSDQIQDSLGKSSNKELKNGFEAIDRNCEDLLNLVNQLLALSKLENKSLHLNNQRIDIIPMIHEIVENFRSSAAKKKIELYFKSNIFQLTALVDKTKFHVVISNLISNAIKFTPENGSVEVDFMVRSEEEIVIKVKDNGYGIVEADLDLIFDRFYQSHLEQSMQVGTGIGLSLCKELIELMSGSIFVESKKGLGSTFTISLPYSKIVVEKDVIESDVAADDVMKMESDKTLVLVVEDNEDVTNYLKSLLVNDYKVVTATDGQLGHDKAIELIPDLIISDVMMPKMDGFTLCKSLKGNFKTNHIPIIMLTAKTDFNDKMEGLKTGADAYLTKPFRKEELFVRLNKLSELRLTLQEKYSQFALLDDPKALKKENSFIHTVHTILDENLSNIEFNVERLAEKVFLSRMQLHRKLKAISGKSASHYIRLFRLYKSKPMLSDQNLSISEVAWSVGFQDANYFSKSFSKEFGKTPSAYRSEI